MVYIITSPPQENHVVSKESKLTINVRVTYLINIEDN